MCLGDPSASTHRYNICHSERRLPWSPSGATTKGGALADPGGAALGGERASFSLARSRPRLGPAGLGWDRTISGGPSAFRGPRAFR